MRVGLIDVDRTGFPNVALMKLSAWHKAQGDDVDLLRGHRWLLMLLAYDKVYASVSGESDQRRQCNRTAENIGGEVALARLVQRWRERSAEAIADNEFLVSPGYEVQRCADELETELAGLGSPAPPET